MAVLTEKPPKVKTFPVVEIFGPTIQGEGAEAGLACHFVRLGGCDFRCSWCDTVYAVDPAEVRRNSEQLSAEQIADRLEGLAGSPEWVILSGGNPALHELGPLVEALQAGLDRLMDLLTDHDVAIEAISFEPFELPDGEIIMIREITETPADTGADRASDSEKLKRVLAHAQENGVRSTFEDFLKTGAELGLPARAYVVTVMFTPPMNKTRMLFAIWADKGATWLDTSFETFEEFFPEVTADEARRHLGAEKRRQLDQEGAASFLAGLKTLLG